VTIEWDSMTVCELTIEKLLELLYERVYIPIDSWHAHSAHPAFSESVVSMVSTGEMLTRDLPLGQ
jgi:hypothetical protein